MQRQVFVYFYRWRTWRVPSIPWSLCQDRWWKLRVRREYSGHIVLRLFFREIPNTDVNRIAEQAKIFVEKGTMRSENGIRKWNSTVRIIETFEEWKLDFGDKSRTMRLNCNRTGSVAKLNRFSNFINLRFILSSFNLFLFFPPLLSNKFTC